MLIIHIAFITYIFFVDITDIEGYDKRFKSVMNTIFQYRNTLGN